MTENNFRRKISALMLAAVITASALSAALPASQDSIPAEDTTVSDSSDSVNENDDQ